MKNEFELAFNEIAEVRTLKREVVLEALQNALISAYRRDTGAMSSQEIDARIDPNTGRVQIFVEKEVVEEVISEHTEVDLETARFYDPEAQYGDMVMVRVGTTKNFGRIAAQTAKQVILQRIREAERRALYDEFISKEGEIIHAQIQSVSGQHVIVSLNGRSEAKMPRAHMIPGEVYKVNEKIRVYLLEVKHANRGPEILVSRTHRNMLRRLLEYEVPEIEMGQVEIKSIAREAGGRSKVAVHALQDGIDPVGACVGYKGGRIQNIVNELHREKIDVIEWNPNQSEFIQKALSPARVRGVYLEDDPDLGRTAVVIVPDDQLSLAIGREGQNARLAAKLTGWRIDIKSVSEAVTWALEQVEAPHMKAIRENQAVLLEDVRRIMDKRANNLSVTAEEFTVLGMFADIVEKHLVIQRNEARKSRMAEINAVRETLPKHVFEYPVVKLDLPDDLLEALEPLQNAGEIMLRFLIDESRLRRLLGTQSETKLNLVQLALDKLVNTVDEPVAEAVKASTPAEAVMPEVEPIAVKPRDDDEEADYSLGDEALLEEQAKHKLGAKDFVAPAVEEDIEALIEEEGFSSKDKKGKKKKPSTANRQLVFDEEVGEVKLKRQRKGNRKRDDWGDF